MVQEKPVKEELLVIVPNLQLGGQERVAVNTAEIMLSDFDVTMLTFNNDKPVYECLSDLIDLKISVRKSRFGKVLSVIERTIAVKRIRKKKKPNYVMSFGWSANLVNVLSRGIGKTMTSIRGYANIGTGLIDKVIYKHSDKIICCSKEMCYKLETIIPKQKRKICCLYNPYDLNKITELGKETVEDYSFSSHTIVTHGRLEYVKGYDRLIRAFEKVKKQVPDAQLLILGEGSERLNLEALVKELGLNESVKLIGMRKNPFAYLAKASLYVLSSRNEGFPNSLVEGMAFLPIVAVDCKSGPREIMEIDSNKEIDKVLETEVGYLVDESDSDALVEWLELAIISGIQSNSLLEKGMRAKERISAFSIDKFRIELKQILQD